MTWLSEGATQVAWNVVGGAVTVGLFESFRWGHRKLIVRKYRAVFGNDIGSKEFHLVYGLLSLKPLDPPDSRPYRKQGLSQVEFSIAQPVSSCELRAAKYASESIAKNRFSPPKLTSDLDLSSKLDLSFIAFGGPLSNCKTRDALESEASPIRMEPSRFVSKRTGNEIINLEAGFDYGLILKVHPPQFPARTWVICAGLGEWGSSGAAWYLARKWREIYDFVGDGTFAVIVKVRSGQDEYAEPVFREKTTQESSQTKRP